jgi:hypothetical protein
MRAGDRRAPLSAQDGARSRRESPPARAAAGPGHAEAHQVAKAVTRVIMQSAIPQVTLPRRDGLAELVVPRAREDRTINADRDTAKERRSRPKGPTRADLAAPAPEGGHADGSLQVPWAALFSKGVTVGFGRTHDRRHTTHLRDLIISGRARPGQIVTHHESLENAPSIYDRFDRRVDGIVKAVFHH